MFLDISNVTHKGTQVSWLLPFYQRCQSRKLVHLTLMSGVRLIFNYNAFSLMQYKLPSLGHICLIMKPYAIQTKILLYTFWCQNLTGALPFNSFNTVSYVQYFLSIFFSFKCFQKYDLLCRLLKLFNFFLPFLQWILRDINFNKWNNDPCYTLNSESWDNLS